MLTRNLVSYRVRAGVVSPKYINLDDSEACALVRRIDEMVKDGIGESYEEVSAITKLQASRDRKLAPSIAHLMLQKAIFADSCPSLESERRDIFQMANELRKSLAEDSDAATYRDLLKEKLSAEMSVQLDNGLYRDLPERRLLQQTKRQDVDAWINLYNVSQVQGLLFHASQLTISMPVDGQGQQVRSLIRIIKFHRLLMDIKDSNDKWHLELTGPTALFQRNTQYGQRFAVFFPYLLQFSGWSLEAELDLPRHGSCVLRLPLKKRSYLSTYKSVSSYIPEEFSRVVGEFNRNKPGGWHAEIGGPLINLGQRNYVFPDIVLMHVDGKKIPIELFHKWHRSQLLQRVRLLSEGNCGQLCLGVERKLSKDENIGIELERFRQNGGDYLSFSEFPSPRQLKSLIS